MLGTEGEGMIRKLQTWYGPEWDTVARAFWALVVCSLVLAVAAPHGCV